MPKKLLSLFLLLVFVVTMGAGCSSKKATQKNLERVTLNYWRVWDGEDNFKPLIEAYNKSQPNVLINYRQLSYEEYEAALLDAWAEDRGPDIFSIQNTWVRKYETKITNAREYHYGAPCSLKELLKRLSVKFKPKKYFY